MPGDADQCRHQAARCAELAATARTPELKTLFLELAARWQALAVDGERLDIRLSKDA
jgi:hypothetical protein